MDEQGKPAVGRVPDPWRTADARVRSRPVDGLEIHGASSQPAVSNLEDISSKSRTKSAAASSNNTACGMVRPGSSLVAIHNRGQFSMESPVTEAWFARDMWPNQSAASIAGCSRARTLGPDCSLGIRSLFQ